jgi:hypothetical protein
MLVYHEVDIAPPHPKDLAATLRSLIQVLGRPDEFVMSGFDRRDSIGAKVTKDLPALASYVQGDRVARVTRRWQDHDVEVLPVDVGPVDPERLLELVAGSPKPFPVILSTFVWRPNWAGADPGPDPFDFGTSLQYYPTPQPMVACWKHDKKPIEIRAWVEARVVGSAPLTLPTSVSDLLGAVGRVHDRGLVPVLSAADHERARSEDVAAGALLTAAVARPVPLPHVTERSEKPDSWDLDAHDLRAVGDEVLGPMGFRYVRKAAKNTQAVWAQTSARGNRVEVHVDLHRSSWVRECRLRASVWVVGPMNKAHASLRILKGLEGAPQDEAVLLVSERHFRDVMENVGVAVSAVTPDLATAERLVPEAPPWWLLRDDHHRVRVTTTTWGPDGWPQATTPAAAVPTPPPTPAALGAPSLDETFAAWRDARGKARDAAEAALLEAPRDAALALLLSQFHEATGTLAKRLKDLLQRAAAGADRDVLARELAVAWTRVSRSPDYGSGLRSIGEAVRDHPVVIQQVYRLVFGPERKVTASQRANAIDALATMVDPNTLRALVTRARMDRGRPLVKPTKPDPSGGAAPKPAPWRDHIVRALADLRTPQATATLLLEAAADAPPAEYELWRALVAVWGGEALPWLGRRFAADPAHALMMVSHEPPPGVGAWLRCLTTRPQEEVASKAMSMLKRMVGDAAAPWVKGWLEDRARQLRLQGDAARAWVEKSMNNWQLPPDVEPRVGGLEGETSPFTPGAPDPRRLILTDTERHALLADEDRLLLTTAEIAAWSD